MRINHTLTYPTTPNDLVAVLSNEDFIVSRFTKLGLTPEISISELPTNTPSSVTNSGCTVRTSLSIPASALPNQVRSFLPSTIHAVLVETFTPSGEEWQVRTTLEVEAMPINAQGTSTLRSIDAGTERIVEGEVNVKIPFIGRKVEEMLGHHVGEAAEAEVRSVREWLTR